MLSFKEILLFKKIAKAVAKTPKTAKIGIFVHENADPDAIYSALALKCILEQKGFNNLKIFIDENSNELAVGAQKFTDCSCITNNPNLKIDVSFILDLSQSSRLGIFEKLAMNSKTIFVFDHHEKPDIQNTIGAFFPDMSSTGEVLFHFLNKFKVSLTKEIATLLYISIMSDTQRLTVSVNRGTAFLVVKELIATGINTVEALGALSRKLLPEEMKAICKSIKEMKTFGNITMFKFDATKKEFKIDYDKIKDKSTWMLSNISGIKVLLIIVIYEDKVKGSFRSFCELDVNELAEKLGGGGHKKAAGFTTDLTDNYIVSICEEFYNKK